MIGRSCVFELFPGSPSAGHRALLDPFSIEFETCFVEIWCELDHTRCQTFWPAPGYRSIAWVKGKESFPRHHKPSGSPPCRSAAVLKTRNPTIAISRSSYQFTQAKHMLFFLPLSCGSFLGAWMKCRDADH